jgi:hypothetical protein
LSGFRTLILFVKRVQRLSLLDNSLGTSQFSRRRPHEAVHELVPLRRREAELEAADEQARPRGRRNVQDWAAEHSALR